MRNSNVTIIDRSEYLNVAKYRWHFSHYEPLAGNSDIGIIPRKTERKPRKARHGVSSLLRRTKTRNLLKSKTRALRNNLRRRVNDPRRTDVSQFKGKNNVRVRKVKLNHRVKIAR